MYGSRRAGVTAAFGTCSRTVGASVVGTVAQYYDFFIYGTASALAFNGRLRPARLARRLLIPTGLFALLTTRLSEEAFLSWGWPVPFLLSIFVAPSACSSG
ncbi:hypothetical protein ACGFRB_23000 [Streptomyces sp. NPDC048718]|uniref:hypothetical protein n=1 Tax=Streptomyces sp. NPDC048718 TaxID=3365587 RepID=UPI00372311A4